MTDKLYQIKHRLTGAVLFELQCGLMRLCVEAAVSADADLRDANLRSADLRGADLRGADLRGADLRGADLSDANLRDANLSGAYLSNAYLSGAYLSNANLRGADLRGAYLLGADLIDGIPLIFHPILIDGLYWHVIIIDGHMNIGCEMHSHDEWDGYDDDTIKRMDVRHALPFWKEHKSTLMALCRAHAAKIKTEEDKT